MNFDHYRGLLFGIAGVVFLAEFVFFKCLPKFLLTEIIEKLFNIKRIDSHSYVFHFYGVEVDLRLSRRFRYSFIFLIATLIWINILIIIDGCVLQFQNISMNDPCPSAKGACFVMGKITSHSRVDCLPGEMFTNSSGEYLGCFIWVYSQQTAVDVLNQIGICSSIFSLLCYAFRALSRMSHCWWGLVLLIILFLSSFVFSIVSFVIELKLSMTARLLNFAVAAITLNTIQLLEFTHLRHRCRKIKRKLRLRRTNTESDVEKVQSNHQI